MSLVERIAQADERGLAASGLACLDRCLPLLGADDELLRPLWASLADGSDWGASLEKARGALGAEGPDEEEAALLVRRMLQAAPAERTAGAVRPWADACSVAALRVHRLLDPAVDGMPDTDGLDAGRAGDMADLPPLVAAELRRQTAVLDLLAEHGPHGLRRALDLSIEGRRVLRAVVSRRARSESC
ncbi:hypothetical protein [Streptomyces roseochromogenus]|uniref:Uncharacterized protein n=1 Tax=Streptomyces roseochromogenus subsp. oscitans DS 12.976 TaxID=1352936 RepID=V6KHC6_STRRC|nr:hypothetical protein [Streptomyces roseochromogenus]EST31575.1 hypothetical protein M878_16200 [Streptomyces roseochromogenus subsp. oscitans DS 12.976]